jgi:hypothetical protein
VLNYLEKAAMCIYDPKHVVWDSEINIGTMREPWSELNTDACTDSHFAGECLHIGHRDFRGLPPKKHRLPERTLENLEPSRDDAKKYIINTLLVHSVSILNT